jgi:trimethylamine--corrinoid protein Co-methyltransferase
MEWAQLLKAEAVREVHEASLLILERTGIRVRNEKARQFFAGRGCPVDGNTGVVRIPASLVEEQRKLFVPSFVFRGRDPRFDRTLPADGPIMITASSAPDLIDLDTGLQRRALAADIGRTARVRRLFHLHPGR